MVFSPNGPSIGSSVFNDPGDVTSASQCVCNTQKTDTLTGSLAGVARGPSDGILMENDTGGTSQPDSTVQRNLLARFVG